MPRQHQTIVEHIETYNELLAYLNKEIDKKSRHREPGVRGLQKIRKTVTLLKKEAPYIHARPRQPRSSTAKTGITKKYPITPELADFLKIDHDSKISRVEAVCAICVYAKFDPHDERKHMLKWKHLNPKGKRNLQDPEFRRSIIPDESLSLLLNYKQYKKQIKKGKITRLVRNKETRLKIKTVVDDDRLFYWTIQKLLTPHFIVS